MRELKNLLEGAVLTGEGSKLSAEELGLGLLTIRKGLRTVTDETILPPLPPEGMDLDAKIRFFEKFYIEEALKIAKGNESKAAKLLSINHHTFRYRRKKLMGK